jgi:hypothetical protein
MWSVIDTADGRIVRSTKTFGAALSYADSINRHTAPLRPDLPRCAPENSKPRYLVNPRKDRTNDRSNNG